MKIQNIIKLVVVSSIILAFLCIAYYYSFKRPMYLDKYHRYTLCKIDNISAPAEGDLMGDYSYVIKNNIYHGVFTINNTKPFKQEIGNRYFLKYYPPDPENAEIILDKLVPDSIKQPPSNGWEKLP